MYLKINCLSYEGLFVQLVIKNNTIITIIKNNFKKLPIFFDRYKRIDSILSVGDKFESIKDGDYICYRSDIYLRSNLHDTFLNILKNKFDECEFITTTINGYYVTIYYCFIKI